MRTGPFGLVLVAVLAAGQTGALAWQIDSVDLPTCVVRFPAVVRLSEDRPKGDPRFRWTPVGGGPASAARHRGKGPWYYGVPLPEHAGIYNLSCTIDRDTRVWGQDVGVTWLKAPKTGAQGALTTPGNCVIPPSGSKLARAFAVTGADSPDTAMGGPAAAATTVPPGPAWVGPELYEDQVVDSVVGILNEQQKTIEEQTKTIAMLRAAYGQLWEKVSPGVPPDPALVPGTK